MTEKPEDVIEVAREHFEYFLGEAQQTARAYQTLYELFEHEPEISIPLLNKLAPSLFHQVFCVLCERVYLGIAKITDPAEARIRGVRYRNLSAAGVIAAFDDAGFDTGKLSRHHDAMAAFGKTYELKNLRNKHLAHLDAEVVLNAKGLKQPPFRDLGKFFVPLQEFIEEGSALLDCEFTHEVFILTKTGYGDKLFDWLHTLGFDETPNSARKRLNKNSLPPCYRGLKKLR